MTTLQKKTDSRVIEVVRRLKDAGYEAYIVGGAVRDFLLGHKPKDYDIATSATPEQVQSVFRERKTLIIGKRFRLVHLHLAKREIVEISTFRTNPNPQDQEDRPPRAAHAPEGMIFDDNEFGTAYEDAFRRDFTMNALFYDPVEDRLEDYTGQGVEDIRNGIIRIIGDPVLRFREDPVRILRALKLLGQYPELKLDPDTESALREAIAMTAYVSASRLSLELEKILRNPCGGKIIRVLQQYDFLQYFLPGFAKYYDTDAMQYALELWEERDARVRSGKARDSMSVILALCALPFFETARGELWEFHLGLAKEFRTKINELFRPRGLPRVKVTAAVDVLLTQLRLKNITLSKFPELPVEARARELAIIQNNVQWHIKKFEKILPPPAKAQKRKYRVTKKAYKTENAGGAGNENNAGITENIAE